MNNCNLPPLGKDEAIRLTAIDRALQMSSIGSAEHLVREAKIIEAYLNAPYSQSYPLHGSWNDKITHIIQQAGRGMLLSEIVGVITINEGIKPATNTISGVLSSKDKHGNNIFASQKIDGGYLKYSLLQMN